MSNSKVFLARKSSIELNKEIISSKYVPESDLPFND